MLAMGHGYTKHISHCWQIIHLDAPCKFGLVTLLKVPVIENWCSHLGIQMVLCHSCTCLTKFHTTQITLRVNLVVSKDPNHNTTGFTLKVMMHNWVYFYYNTYNSGTSIVLMTPGSLLILTIHNSGFHHMVEIAIPPPYSKQ